MALVIDVSVGLKWLLPEHDSNVAQAEAQEGLALLRVQVGPTPTAGLELHDFALEIALALDHSPRDTMYVAFATAMGAEKVIVAGRKFAAAMRRHPDPAVAGLAAGRLGNRQQCSRA